MFGQAKTLLAFPETPHWGSLLSSTCEDMVKSTDSGARLSLNSGSITFSPCDLELVSWFLCAIISSSIKQEKKFAAL